MSRHEKVLLEKLQASGLEVIEISDNQQFPSVDQAWMAIANFEVRPVASTPLEGEDTTSRLNSLWLQNARLSEVISEDGSFLITIVSTGSHEIGWVRVRWTPEFDVSRLIDDQGKVEFVARSISGHHICGVTAEEYEYWIVSLDVSEPL
ncbi:hypothetical protein ACFXPN_40130 [Streptomyces griseorubiginosus]|uniref:hypothetical protein n=1 Tax=Streptomyces griseorubiginosus TaxID=67304 RepID=UPI0036D0E58A